MARGVPDGYDFPATSLAMDILGCAAAVSSSGPFGTVGVGHSLGATALVLAEALRPGTFQALYLYEPAIMPAEAAAARLTRESAGITRMLRRRRSFGSREEAYASYVRRAPLDTFVADALCGYVEHGFTDDAEGGVTLACLPESAVGIALGGISTVAFERLRDVRCPVLVARGTAPNPLGRAGFESGGCRPSARRAARVPGRTRSLRPAERARGRRGVDLGLLGRPGWSSG